MKKVCFFLMCVLMLAACKKTAIDPSKYAYSFIANGTQFVGNSYTASYIKDTSNGKLVFLGRFYEGTPSDSVYMGIVLSDSAYIDTGSYTNVGPLFFDNKGYFYHQEFGTYSITKLDTANHLISGTFQFRCTNSLMTVLDVNVSAGAFTNIQYKTQ